MLAARRLAVQANKRAFANVQVAGFAADSWQDKEKAAEQVYFNKEDEKSLRKLLKKLKGQADKTDAKGLKDHVEHDLEGLEKISGLNLSKEQKEALIKWKHDH